MNVPLNGHKTGWEGEVVAIYDEEPPRQTDLSKFLFGPTYVRPVPNETNTAHEWLEARIGSEGVVVCHDEQGDMRVVWRIESDQLLAEAERLHALQPRFWLEFYLLVGERTVRLRERDRI